MVVSKADFSGKLSDEGMVNVKQAGLRHLDEKQAAIQGKLSPFTGQVKKVYSDRGTADVQTATEFCANVPISFRMGYTSEGKIWGELELPEVDDYVLVLPLDSLGRRRLIIPSFYPYLLSGFQGEQQPVASTHKAFTLKLLEENLVKTYRKIFPSGTSLEVKEDGSYILETPSGSFFQFDEDGKKIKLSHKDGSNIATFSLDGNHGYKLLDKYNNKIEATSSGLNIADTNGNTIAMGSVSVIINNNLEVLQ